MRRAVGTWELSTRVTAVDSRSLVFLVDVDNTLLDNDRLKEDLASRLEGVLGARGTARFWQLYETVRAERDYVDFPATIARWEEECADSDQRKAVRDIFAHWDFKTYLYPYAVETLRYLETLGTVVILSDGDTEFQPRKIRESGLEAVVEGRVLVYVHKENEIPAIFARYPADHYVVIDDKPRILSLLEECCPTEFTTVLVCQGKYASEAEMFAPRPDCVVRSIGAVRTLTHRDFLSGCGSDAQEPEHGQKQSSRRDVET